MYIEGSRPQPSGKSAVLSTPPLSASSQKVCVLFYYHMRGRTMGSLKVNVNYFSPTRLVTQECSYHLCLF